MYLERVNKKELRKGGVAVTVILLVLIGGYMGYMFYISEQTLTTRDIESDSEVSTVYILEQGTSGFDTDVVASYERTTTFTGFMSREIRKTERYDSDTHILYTSRIEHVNNITDGSCSGLNRGTVDPENIVNSRFVVIDTVVMY